MSNMCESFLKKIEFDSLWWHLVFNHPLTCLNANPTYSSCEFFCYLGVALGVVTIVVAYLLE